MRDYSQMSYKERIALNDGLKYVNLNEKGKIGLVCNSAGYALATMDLVASYGQTCQNFTDLAGNAYFEQITASLVILEKSSNVKVILINMFCGNMYGDAVAQTVITAF